jgi:general stress protein YciG
LIAARRSKHLLSTMDQRRMSMANNQQGGNQGGQDKRGFASMDPNKQREIASEGGRAAHRSGNAHEFTSEEARAAGQMSHKNDDQNSGNRGSASSSGTRGGSSEQHAEAGRQSHKNSGNQQSGDRGSESSGMRGGSSEQHSKAGQQSHKNQK